MEWFVFTGLEDSPARDAEGDLRDCLMDYLGNGGAVAGSYGVPGESLVIQDYIELREAPEDEDEDEDPETHS
jgi:hypothetical protein